MLAYCGITNAQHVQIGRFRVPKQAIWIYIMLTQVYFGGMQVAVIAKNYRGGLPAILFAVHCIVLIASKATIYAVMVVNTGKMFRLMAYLEAVVNARKFHGKSWPGEERTNTTTSILENSHFCSFTFVSWPRRR